MPVTVPAAVFLVAAVVSLATSWVLVSRLERVGERLGLSEALLGLTAALAADAPEISAAVTAIIGHQQRLGAGVVIGSNVFNLAALLGLAAIVAGRISLHRKAVILGGAVAVPVAGACLAVVAGLIPAIGGLALAFGVLALYAAVAGLSPRSLRRLPLPPGWITWLGSAVAEEELELQAAILPRRGTRRDAAVAAGSLLVVVAASVAMERAASALGGRLAIPQIVVGGLVLAAVTSLPNAVAAIYLAARGRGAATLSTALNSNALNVTLGMLIPAAVIGLGRPTGQATLVAAWYAGLTGVALLFAYRDRGMGRATGSLILAAYLLFAGSLLEPAWAPWLAAAACLIVAAFAVRPALGRRPSDLPSRAAHPAAAAALRPGWPGGRLWGLGLALTLTVAAVDVGLGHRVVLIGLLIIGPCSVLLTGRWIQTGLTGLCAIGLAVALGIPDGIWGTGIHLAFLTAVVVVALASTLAAAVIGAARP